MELEQALKKCVLNLDAFKKKKKIDAGITQLFCLGCSFIAPSPSLLETGFLVAEYTRPHTEGTVLLWLSYASLFLWSDTI